MLICKDVCINDEFTSNNCYTIHFLGIQRIIFTLLLSMLIYSCRNGRCIDEKWRCDQDDDCGDGSDEVSCQNKTCHPDQFSCASGHCINKQWKCDGEIDCEDGSDEKSKFQFPLTLNALNSLPA